MYRTAEYPQRENLITRINYNSRLTGLCEIAVFGIAGTIGSAIESGIIPNHDAPWPLKGHINDFFGGAFYASMATTIFNEGFTFSACAGFVTCSIIEIGQGTSVIPVGTFDWWDFPAYALGACSWKLYKESAKWLYDSGLTKPIYKVLGIQDRRVITARNFALD